MCYLSLAIPLPWKQIKKYISYERKKLFEKVTVSNEPALGQKRLHFCYLFHRKFVIFMVILTGCLESVLLMVYYFIRITGNESKCNE